MLIWLAPVVVFGLVIFVHELGHFLAAKATGVYTPRFAIGFGPAIVRWRRGETEYRIGILPLGGYVRMASRLDEDVASLEGGGEKAPSDKEPLDPDAMIPFGPRPVPEERWFESKSLGARLVIMLAGVAMNLLLGWVINIGLAKAYAADVTTRVSQVVAGKPAAAAGILPGDSVVSVNGARVTGWDSLVAIVGRSAGVPLSFGIVRDGEVRSVVVRPEPDSVVDPATGARIVAGRVGLQAAVAPGPVPWGRALAEGTRATGAMAGLVFSSLRRIATREASVAELGGPIAIAQSSVQAARRGWAVLLYLVSLLSVNLAVFNLLPVPILDGGQILVQLVEAARGRPLTDRAREYVMRLGLALIILLFITVMFNDLKRIVIAALAGGAAG